MGYEGHTVMIPDPDERRKRAEEAIHLLVSTSDLIKNTGYPVNIVSCGGTGTYDVSGKYPGVSEVQAGSYLTMDAQYHENVGIKEFEYALFLIATVIHCRGKVAIIDAGLNSLTTDFGMPVII